MGKLLNKKIVQARAFIDPELLPIPKLDYYYTYPITLFDAVKKTNNNDSSNLTDEFMLVDQKLSLKQDQIPGKTTGSIVTYTNENGIIGVRPVVSSINNDPLLRNNNNIPTERAVGIIADTKVNNVDFNNHTLDKNIHINSDERTRWNDMTPLVTFNTHAADEGIHITPLERGSWNNKTDKKDFISHIDNINNPHSVTAGQINTYTKPEIDSKILSLQTKFFNYMNIVWDSKSGIAKLVEYNINNWDPNYILGYGERLPDIGDPTRVYFALAPATNYLNDQTNDIIIYIKKPSMVWVEIGRQTLKGGDLVVRYPDTAMFLWMGGRFVEILTRNSDNPGNTPGNNDYNKPMPAFTLKGNNTNSDAAPQNVKYADVLNKLMDMINIKNIANLLKPYLDINDIGDKDILGKRWITSNFNISSYDANNEVHSLGIKIYYFNGVWISYNHNDGIYYSTGGRYWMPTNIQNVKIINCYEDNGLLYAVEIGHMGPGAPVLTYYYSSDGKYWNSHKEYNSGYNIIYQNGMWFSGITGYRRITDPESNYRDNGYAGFGIRYSEDGINWKNSNITSGIIYECYYYNNIWLMVIENINSVENTSTFSLYYSNDGKIWNSSQISPQEHDLHIVNRNGILFIFNLNNITYFSTDSIHWISTKNSFMDCICINNIWVAIGYIGLYYTIDNGVSWNKVIGVTINDISYNNNMWIAVANRNIYYSTDGINWTVTTAFAGPGSYNYFGDISYGGGTLIVPGYRKLCYSTDGINWNYSSTAVNAGSNFKQALYGGGVWNVVTSTGIWYSADNCVTWDIYNTAITGSINIMYNNNVWIAVNYTSNLIYYSTDGKVWAPCTLPVGSSNVRFIDYKNNMWLITLHIESTGLDWLCWSSDGITWTKSDISANDIRIEYNTNGWVIYNYNRIELITHYSTDGKVWNNGPVINLLQTLYYPANGIVVTWSTEGIKYSTDGNVFNQTNITSPINMCWNENDIWFALYMGMIAGEPSMLSYYSLDGILWQTMDIFITPEFITNPDAVTSYYNDGKWIKLDGSYETDPTSNLHPELKYYYSTNGINWVHINVLDNPANQIKYIYYANNLWVASLNISNDTGDGWHDCVCYSEDGVNWVRSNMGNHDSFEINDIMQYCLYANNIWVLAGKHEMHYSYDGKFWQSANIIHNNNNDLWDFHICYYIHDTNTWICNGHFNDGSDNKSTELCYSHDGKIWYYIAETIIDTNDRIVSYNRFGGVIIACGLKGLYFSSGKEWYGRPKLEEPPN